MNRLTAILATIVLTLLGSGALSALHRAVHHGSCASGCGGTSCAVDRAFTPCSHRTHSTGCASARCVSAACASVACGTSAVALVDQHSSSPCQPDQGPRETPGDEPRLPLHDCGFCSLLALPVTIAVATAMPLSPHLVQVPTIAHPDAVIRSRHRAGPHGARAPPLA